MASSVEEGSRGMAAAAVGTHDVPGCCTAQHAPSDSRSLQTMHTSSTSLVLPDRMSMALCRGPCGAEPGRLADAAQ